jgi:two-component system NarL family response regulator
VTEAHSSEPVRVLVVDDQELFRRGLIMLLSGDTDIEVVGEAADGVTAPSGSSSRRTPRDR